MIPNRSLDSMPGRAIRRSVKWPADCNRLWVQAASLPEDLATLVAMTSMRAGDRQS